MRSLVPGPAVVAGRSPLEEPVCCAKVVGTAEAGDQDQ